MATVPPARLILTVGEPAGIGPDIALAVAERPFDAEIVAVGDPAVLATRARQCGNDVEFVAFDANTAPQRHRPGVLPLLPLSYPAKVSAGRLDPANARALLDGLDLATDLVRRGSADALVTGPVQKSIINDAGIAFTGHTEYLQTLTGAPLPVMLLVAGELRVALATTHLRLADVPTAIDADGLGQVIRVLAADLTRLYRIEKPRIVVCGLNPHAGESGHLGREERDIIAPLIARMIADGYNLAGPLPADTVFTPAGGPADAVLAMYHDQGLPVVKYAGFGNAVNVTLGLPIVRTSVDHGTALDIAGTGKADAGSLTAALNEALRLADRR